MIHKHIVIKDKSRCSGCKACKSVCPKSCITMQADAMGSKYPVVDASVCVECGACVNVCPFLNPSASSNAIKCFAAVNVNEDVRIKSSSGGVFSVLAHYVLSKGGVVVGAVFNNDWEVEHALTDSIDGVGRMMGSKYVQSDTLSTFIDTKRHLLDGRIVLYTGTPCQIAGLNHFLYKPYPNLFTVEVICHGAPERNVWRSYLDEICTKTEEGFGRNGNEVLSSSMTANKAVIDDISFRDKRNGWRKYGVAIRISTVSKEMNNPQASTTIKSIYEPFKENPYMRAFLRNMSLRPSCYACQAKGGKSHADITIGDFWGIEHCGTTSDDDKGVSAIVCRSEKGLDLLIQCKELKLTDCSYQDILRSNPSLERDVAYTEDAKIFHKLFPQKGFNNTLRHIDHPLFFRKMKLSLKYRISALLKKKL